MRNIPARFYVYAAACIAYILALRSIMTGPDPSIFSWPVAFTILVTLVFSMHFSSPTPFSPYETRAYRYRHDCPEFNIWLAESRLDSKYSDTRPPILTNKLIELYEFGARIQNNGFKNKVMDYIQHAVEKELIPFDNTHILKVFEDIPNEAFPLRKFCLCLLTYKLARGFWNRTYIKKFLFEKCPAVERDLRKLQEENLGINLYKGGPWVGSYGMCFFHVHDKGEAACVQNQETDTGTTYNLQEKMEPYGLDKAKAYCGMALEEIVEHLCRMEEEHESE